MRGLYAGWFSHHVYLAVFLACVLEGIGLPLPAEVLFLATVGVIGRGNAHLGGVIAAAAGGNLVGSLAGFTVAYIGGQRLIERVFRLIGVKAESIHKVAAFFRRYGAVTVFLSRFVGVIRAATIYTAGAARMNPWRFGFYVAIAALIWNGGWAILAYQFGSHLPALVHRALGRGAVWLVSILVVAFIIRFVYSWHRRKSSAKA